MKTFFTLVFILCSSISMACEVDDPRFVDAKNAFVNDFNSRKVSADNFDHRMMSYVLNCGANLPLDQLRALAHEAAEKSLKGSIFLLFDQLKAQLASKTNSHNWRNFYLINVYLENPAALDLARKQLDPKDYDSRIYFYAFAMLMIGNEADQKFGVGFFDLLWKDPVRSSANEAIEYLLDVRAIEKTKVIIDLFVKLLRDGSINSWTKLGVLVRMMGDEHEERYRIIGTELFYEYMSSKLEHGKPIEFVTRDFLSYPKTVKIGRIIFKEDILHNTSISPSEKWSVLTSRSYHNPSEVIDYLNVIWDEHTSFIERTDLLYEVIRYHDLRGFTVDKVKDHLTMMIQLSGQTLHGHRRLPSLMSFIILPHVSASVEQVRLVLDAFFEQPTDNCWYTYEDLPKLFRAAQLTDENSIISYLMALERKHEFKAETLLHIGNQALRDPVNSYFLVGEDAKSDNGILLSLIRNTKSPSSKAVLLAAAMYWRSYNKHLNAILDEESETLAQFWSAWDAIDSAEDKLFIYSHLPERLVVHEISKKRNAHINELMEQSIVENYVLESVKWRLSKS